MKPLTTDQVAQYLCLALGRAGYRLGLVIHAGGETWTVRRTMRRHQDQSVVLAVSVQATLVDARSWCLNDVLRRCVNAGLVPDPDEARSRRA